MNNAEQGDWLVSSSDMPLETRRERLTSEVVVDVYRMYRQNFWKFYRLALPPTLLALLVYTVRPLIIAGLTSGLSRTEILTRPLIILGTFLTNFGSFFLAWSFEVFTLAAVSDAVGALHKGAAVPEGDGYVRARERTWELLKISLATFIPFVVGFLFLMVFGALAIFKLGWHLPGNYWFGVGQATLQMFVLAAALIGFAFAVPLVMATDATAGKALRTSWRLTDGHEGKLIFFVAESLLGALLAMYAISWIGYVVFSRIHLGGWETWVMAITTALAGAAAQAPMLIAFALLYFQVTDPQQA